MMRLTTQKILLVLTIGLAGTVTAAWGQEKYELERGVGFKKVHEPDPSTPEGQLQAIRKLIADGEPDRASKRAKQWIKAYPNHPLLAQAYLLRGDARAAGGDHYKALFDYEYVLRAYPGSEEFNTALERELTIAEAFGRGVKRKLWGMRILPAAGEAEELYIRIQERAPGSKIAERAGIELSDFYYRRAEMGLAAEAYELFLRNYPSSQWREHAMKRQILANLARFKGPRFDATGLIEAERRLDDYQSDFPAAAEQIGARALLTRIDETLATRTYLVAQWYESRNEPVSAAVMYKRVLRDHGGSVAAQRALDRLRELEPEIFVDGKPVLDPSGSDVEPADQPSAVRPVDSEGLPLRRETDVPAPSEPTDAPPVPRRRDRE
jgi:outer membrane assembly lipoprotein YfiO